MFNRIILALNSFLLGQNVLEVINGTADGFDYTFMGIQIILVFFMVLFKNVWRMD